MEINTPFTSPMVSDGSQVTVTVKPSRFANKNRSVIFSGSYLYWDLLLVVVVLVVVVLVVVGAAAATAGTGVVVLDGRDVVAVEVGPTTS